MFYHFVKKQDATGIIDTLTGKYIAEFKTYEEAKKYLNEKIRKETVLESRR